MSKHKIPVVVWGVLLALLSLIVRVALLPVANGDFNHYLNPWVEFIKANGYFHAFQYDFYNYTPSYIYILAIIAKTGWNTLYSIKAVSYLFEYLLAYFIGRIAYLKWHDKRVIGASLIIMPLLPSIILNSTCLTQCDSIYAAFAVGSIYFALKDKPWWSALFLGISFAFKQQAVMVLPFFFVMMLRGKIKWYCFFMIPAVYFISVIPAWIAGRPLSDLLTIYLHQAGYYQALTMFFPNIYIWLNDDYYNIMASIGVGVTCIATLLSGWALSKKKYVFTLDTWVKLAFAGAIIVPFLLPGMHERYMYVGDVLGVLYLLVIRKNYHLPIGIALVSAYSYACCSRLQSILPLSPGFFLYVLIIVLVIVDLIQSLKTGKGNVDAQTVSTPPQSSER